ncbi:MAG: nucleoside triphosphate pyrophosphohydrolase [Bacteroidota bacterium]
MVDKNLIAFNRLITIMDELRKKCPWDQKQTFESLRTLTIEETYELADAIISKNTKDISSELGDLFLHLVFYCKIGSETNDFTLEEVLNQVCEKLIFRHPHIYGDVEVSSEEDVKKNWEKLKLKEGKKSVLEGVPTSLPALVKAMRIQEKVKGVGFDFEENQQVWDKIQEEVGELKEAIETKTQDEIEDEFGDVLFSIINVSRFANVNPENALERTNKKFIQRFQLMEELILKENLQITDLDLTKLDVFWDKSKEILRERKS